MPTACRALLRALIDLSCRLTYGVVTAGGLWGRRAPLGARAFGRSVLEVYVAGHCWTCAEARRLAAAAAARFPAVEVRVVDVDAAGPLRGFGARSVPDGVVAVPTYLLDGAVVALGNPPPDALFARLRAALLAPVDSERL